MLKLAAGGNYVPDLVIGVYEGYDTKLITVIQDRQFSPGYLDEVLAEASVVTLDLFTTYNIMKLRPISPRIIKQVLLDRFQMMLEKPPVFAAIDLYGNLFGFNLPTAFENDDGEVIGLDDLYINRDDDVDVYINRLKMMIDRMAPVLHQRLLELP